jgi:hypothetical protein
MRFALALLFVAACAARAPTPKAAEDLPALVGTDGASARLAPASGLTVVTFFSAHCPCQRAHDERLVDLYSRYRTSGVNWWVVDSEADSSLSRDRQEAAARHYPFPIRRDDDGVFADFFEAEYATYSVIIDAQGHVVYRGGLDSDKQFMSPTAHLWVRDALDQLLAGKAVEKAETKSFGCELRRR